MEFREVSDRKDSKVIARFKPGVKPFDENLIAAIEVALDSWKRIIEIRIKKIKEY